MAWNPFRAIGNAIGRVFGGREEPAAAPQPEVQPEQQSESQGRGWLGRALDRVTGADQRREEAERERQIEERARELAERERQIEERERQIEEREQAAPPPSPERDLPKFGGETDYAARDERAFGTDSQVERDLQEAVDEFIADRGGLDGLSSDAQEWLEAPTVSEVFADYWQSGGFTADQVVQGIQGISNVRISEGDDGEVQIEFDYDAEIDGYEVHGHAG